MTLLPQPCTYAAGPVWGSQRGISHASNFSSAALAAVLASSASAQSIGGSYNATGTNLDGTAYEGTVEITAVSDTTCTIEWKTGGTNSEGVCMRNGNAFSAAYVQGDALGLLVYEVKEDGSMEGIWTVTGQSGSGTEVLTPAK